MPKKCFVVMGFGQKTDLATGRVLDLDKTYRVLIEPAVTQAGVECIRADSILHSGLIDRPMYELLFGADLVIADLSTANPNAIYELGVRHALKPHTTIVIAEDQFKFPFDLSHLLIRHYEHLGKGIDAEVAAAFVKDLKKAIEELLHTPQVDSPVFEFLPQLLGKKELENAVVAAAAPVQGVNAMVEMFRQAKAAENWSDAADYLKMIVKNVPNDSYFRQQWALATYKSKQPDAVTALQAAKKILQELNPHSSTDPETLGLWGAIHKRLWETTADRTSLEESVRAYQKGFIVKDDHYNGINYAFMLNVRASVTQDPREAQADMVVAERARRRVAGLCAAMKDDPDPAEDFWVKASQVEALFGSGQRDAAEELRTTLQPPETWMMKTLEEQLAKLDALLPK